MELQEALRIIIAGTVGALGFSFLFKSPKRRTLVNVLGSLIVTTIYVYCTGVTKDVFVINLVPALVATVYAEVMARVVKAPSTPILACSIITLVPGSKLYYTTYHFVMGNEMLFEMTFKELLKIGAGICVGIVFITVIVHEINRQKFKQIIDVE